MKPVTRTLLLLFLLNVLNGALGYLVRILFAKHLSVAEFGLFYAVYSFVFFFATFRALGLTEALLFYVPKYRQGNQFDKIKGVLLVSIVPQFAVALLFALLVLLFKPLLVIHYFQQPHSGQVLNLLLGVFAVEIIITVISNFFLVYDMPVYARISETVKICSIIAAFIFFFPLYGSNASVPALAYLVGALVAATFAVLLFSVQFSSVLSARTTIPKGAVKNMFLYGMPIMFSSAASIFISYSDIILLTYFKGVTAVSIYNVAYPSAYIILLMLSPVSTVLFPKISQFYHAKQHGSIQHTIQFVYTYFLLGALPISMLLFAYADIIISVLFGAQYLAAAVPLRIFSVVALIMMLWDVNVAILGGIGKVKERSMLLFVGAAVNVLTGLILVPLYGVVGAAITTGAGFLTIAFFTTRIILKEYPVRIDVIEQIKIVVASIAFLITILFSKKVLVLPLILEAILVLLLAATVYVFALVALRVVTKEKYFYVKRLLF